MTFCKIPGDIYFTIRRLEDVRFSPADYEVI